MSDLQDHPHSDNINNNIMHPNNIKSQDSENPLANHQCKYCHKMLSSKQNLREHVYIHTGEKPYTCREQSCALRFRQGSQLSAHKRIHTAIKSYTNKRSELVYIKVISM